MKRRYLGLLTMTMACAALAAACGDDDDDGAKAGAGGQGQAGGSTAGAGGGTAGQPGAGRQRVTARGFDGPRAGIEVLVHDAEGKLSSRAKTGADGGASVATVAGGSVTVVYDEAVYKNKVVNTYFGLDGGFEFVQSIDDEPFGPAGAGGGPPSMRVRVVPSSPAPLPNRYTVALSCRDGSAVVAPTPGLPPFEDPSYEGCGGKPYDVLVLALDQADVPLAYGVVLDAPFQAGGEATHNVVVDKTDLVKRSYSVQNAPASFTRSLPIAEGERNGARFDDVPVSVDGPSALSGSFWVPPAFFQRVFMSHQISEPSSAGLRRVLSYDKPFEGATPGDLTWPADGMALFTAVTPDVTTDPARPSVTLGVAPQGDLGDALFLRAVWSRADGFNLTWNVTLPPTRAATPRMVELPDDLAGYRPSAQERLNFTQGVLLDLGGREGLAAYLQDASTGRTRDVETRISIGSNEPPEAPTRAGRALRRAGAGLGTSRAAGFRH